MNSRLYCRARAEAEDEFPVSRSHSLVLILVWSRFVKTRENSSPCAAWGQPPKLTSLATCGARRSISNGTPDQIASSFDRVGTRRDMFPELLPSRFVSEEFPDR